MMKFDDINDAKNSLLDPSSHDFIYDDLDDFHDKEDAWALDAAKDRTFKKSFNQEQVLGVDYSSSDEEEEIEQSNYVEVSENEYDDGVVNYSDEESGEDLADEDYLEDDIIEKKESNLPSDRDWGKNKKMFFGTDTSDDRLHKLAKSKRKNAEELAEIEEDTARRLQERLSSQLHDLSSSDFLNESKLEEKKDEKIQLNINLLSKKKKLKLLKEESPEFFPLAHDFKEKLFEIKTILQPLVHAHKKQEITLPEHLFVYINAKYQLFFNYVCTISAYMMLKCEIGIIKDHPVLARLTQYRHLVKELKPCDDKLWGLVKNLADTLDEKKPFLKLLNSTKKRKKLNILEKPKEESVTSEMNDGNSDKVEEFETDDKLNVNADDEKRPIGHTIQKNKGLMPKRKKEQRNPRVKNRNRFRKKLIKRKSQVQGVRKELKRYEGELTGLSKYVVKSIKFK